MTPVTPGLARFSQTVYPAGPDAEATVALNVPGAMFDWSKGSATKNSARTTASSLPKLQAVVEKVENENGRHRRSSTSKLSSSDLLTKVRLLLDAARTSPAQVPELLAGQAKTLNASDFSKLMLSVEEGGSLWSESAPFYVFSYASGSVGSVWLDGSEVYNSIWKNY